MEQREYFYTAVALESAFGIPVPWLLWVESRGNLPSYCFPGETYDICPQRFYKLDEVQRLLSRQLSAQRIEGIHLTLRPEARIEELDLDVRAMRVLSHEGIKTLKQLTELTARELMKFSGLGEVTLAHIKKRLWDCGLKLKDGG